mmetsp:Transcript_22821/g.43019  ORF Transcript_22821/g.43019 Transcript_22821/m.43019 type:complete len:83 (+) Transcript_22821:2680-2928(+)
MRASSSSARSVSSRNWSSERVRWMCDLGTEIGALLFIAVAGAMISGLDVDEEVTIIFELGIIILRQFNGSFYDFTKNNTNTM